MCRKLSTEEEIEYIVIPTVNNNAKTDTAAELAELRDRIEALEEQIAKIDIPRITSRCRKKKKSSYRKHCSFMRKMPQSACRRTRKLGAKSKICA